MSQTSSEHNALRVFSCSTCRNIVADSLSLVYSHDELQTVTFSGVTNKVAPEQTLHTSRERLDKGATFNNLLCTECVQVIGKQYITTPRSLDALRDKFTLFVDRLDTFHLGKVDVGQCGRDDELANQTVPHHGSTVVEDISKVLPLLVSILRQNVSQVSLCLGCAGATRFGGFGPPAERSREAVGDLEWDSHSEYRRDLA